MPNHVVQTGKSKLNISEMLRNISTIGTLFALTGSLLYFIWNVSSDQARGRAVVEQLVTGFAEMKADVREIRKHIADQPTWRDYEVMRKELDDLKARLKKE